MHGSTQATAVVAPESYTRWTSAFGEGLYFKGSWQKGQTIRFMTPGRDGVVSDIAEDRPNEFISLRHFGYIVNGAEDTSSEAIRSWAPADENYSRESTIGAVGTAQAVVAPSPRRLVQRVLGGKSRR